MLYVLLCLSACVSSGFTPMNQLANFH